MLLTSISFLTHIIKAGIFFHELTSIKIEMLSCDCSEDGVSVGRLPGKIQTDGSEACSSYEAANGREPILCPPERNQARHGRRCVKSYTESDIALIRLA